MKTFKRPSRPRGKEVLGAAVIVASLTAVPGPILTSPAFAGPSMTYDQGRYNKRLLDLSGVLGQLHHLRGTCVSGEQQLWRDNMMELVRLENPPSARKNAMVAKFNDAWEDAKKRFPSCSRDARSKAVALASEGAAMSQALIKNVTR